MYRIHVNPNTRRNAYFLSLKRAKLKCSFGLCNVNRYECYRRSSRCQRIGQRIDIVRYHVKRNRKEIVQPLQLSTDNSSFNLPSFLFDFTSSILSFLYVSRLKLLSLISFEYLSSLKKKERFPVDRVCAKICENASLLFILKHFKICVTNYFVTN